MLTYHLADFSANIKMSRPKFEQKSRRPLGPAEVSITRQMPYLTNVLKKGKFKPSFITLDLASFKLNIGTNTSQFYVSILPSQQIQEQQQKMSSSQLAVVQTEIPSSSSKGRGCGSVCLLHAPSHRHVRSRCHCLPARQMGEWCA
jgi:hypothetical protein